MGAPSKSTSNTWKRKTKKSQSKSKHGECPLFNMSAAMCHAFILDDINMPPLVNMDSIRSNEKWFTNIKLSVLETYPWQEDLMIAKMKMLVGLLIGEKLTNLVSISNNIAQLFFKKLQCTWCNLFLRNVPKLCVDLSLTFWNLLLFCFQL